jgi:hypothetical protein
MAYCATREDSTPRALCAMGYQSAPPRFGDGSETETVRETRPRTPFPIARSEYHSKSWLFSGLGWLSVEAHALRTPPGAPSSAWKTRSRARVFPKHQGEPPPTAPHTRVTAQPDPAGVTLTFSIFQQRSHRLSRTQAAVGLGTSRQRASRPWTVTHRVVASFAVGALVIAGATAVATNSSEVGLANLGSANEKANSFSLPAFERDDAGGSDTKDSETTTRNSYTRLIAGLGRSSKKHTNSKHTSKGKRREKDADDAWGVASTSATSSLGKQVIKAPKAVNVNDLVDDDAANLVFALERAGDDEARKRERKRSQKSSKKRSTKKSKQDDEDDAIETASAEELVSMFEGSGLVKETRQTKQDNTRVRSDDDDMTDAINDAVEADFEDVIGDAVVDVKRDGAGDADDTETDRGLDDLFEPSGGALSDDGGGDDDDATYAFEAGVGSEIEGGDGDDLLSAAAADVLANVNVGGEAAGGGVEEGETRGPKITDAMTYEEQQDEYARFAVEESSRNDAIAAQAGEANRVAAEQEETRRATEVTSTEERRARFEHDEAQRRLEFEASLEVGNEAGLGAREVEAPGEARGPVTAESVDAEAPESTDALGGESQPEAEAEAPLDFRPAEAPSAGEASRDSSESDDSSSRVFAESPSMVPDEKAEILTAASHALGPVSGDTNAEVLAEYAEGLVESAEAGDVISARDVATDIDDAFMETRTPESFAFAPAPAVDDRSFEDTLAPGPVSFDDSYDSAAPGPDAFGAGDGAFLVETGDPGVTESPYAAPLPDDDLDAVTARLAAALGAAVEERGVSGERAHAALGRHSETPKTAKVATFDAAADDAAWSLGLDGVVAKAGKGDERGSSHHAASAHAERAKRGPSDSTETHAHADTHATHLTKSQVQRGWTGGDATELHVSDIAKHARAGDARLSEAFLLDLPASVPETDRAFQKWQALSPADAVPAPAPVSVVGDPLSVATTATTHTGKRSRHRATGETNSSLAKQTGVEVDQETATAAAETAVAAEAAAAAAADEEALRVDTTLDAVQQAIANTRRDDRPVATLMLAPLSVVGVAGVVVIAILLVRHRDPPRRTGDGGGDERGSLLGDDRDNRDLERCGGTNHHGATAEALTKTSNANLRALFGSVGEFGAKENFATPSETDGESDLERGKGRVSVRRRIDTNNGGAVSQTKPAATSVWRRAYDKARALAETAERFVDTNARALRLSVARTARMAATMDDESFAGSNVDESVTDVSVVGCANGNDGGGQPPPTKNTVVTPAAPAPSAFSQSEMRKSKSPPSSFVEPAAAFRGGAACSSPKRLFAHTKTGRSSGLEDGASNDPCVVSVDARRRFREAAAMSAHARAFAAPPKPHLARVTGDFKNVGVGNQSERPGANVVFGAGRRVANENAVLAPVMVKSTTRFI